MQNWLIWNLDFAQLFSKDQGCIESFPVLFYLNKGLMLWQGLEECKMWLNSQMKKQKQPKLSWSAPQKHREKHSNGRPLHSVLTEKIFVCKTHQVGLGHVLVFRAVIRWRFAEAVVRGCLRGLSVLSVRSALRTPAEQTDGFPNASLDVNFYTTKGGMLWKHELMGTLALLFKTHMSGWLKPSWLDLPGTCAPSEHAHVYLRYQPQNISEDFPHIFTAEFQSLVWGVRVTLVPTQAQQKVQSQEPLTTKFKQGCHPQPSSPAWLRIITPRNFDSETHPRLTFWLNYSFTLPRLVW